MDKPSSSARAAGLFSLLDRARREPSRTKRDRLYREANERVMEILPEVPLVHTEEYVALRGDVEGYITSPFGPELYSGVSRSS
jgi:dipeptide transport system substrate-binding protein